ncbi:hypothetical protein D3C78_1858720 [compost metagenome]
MPPKNKNIEKKNNPFALCIAITSKAGTNEKINTIFLGRPFEREPYISPPKIAVQ